MKIPKYIQDLLNRRERLADNLVEVSEKIDIWLEKNGADLSDPDISDSVLSGCMIYCEPFNAKIDIENYIKNKM